MTGADHYCQLFDRYVAATDGKKLIARALAAIARTRGFERVLDVGAGNGRIASALAAEGLEITAVEPNPSFAPALRLLSSQGIRIVPTRAQDLTSAIGEFDFAVLVYMLDGLTPDEVRAVCGRVWARVRDGGSVIGVTYADESPWRSFSSVVEQVAGACLVGGHRRVLATLTGTGHPGRVVGTVRSVVEAESLEELFDSLAFFYRRVVEAYARSRAHLLPILAQHARPTASGGWQIGVTEVVFELNRPPATECRLRRQAPTAAMP